MFRPDGVVTAGNCCPLNDGAAAVIVMSDTKAKELGITPLARIVSTGVTGLSPEIMGLGPVEATRQALKHADMTIDDIDLVEINEAFAAQVVPSYQDLGIDLDRLNINGGSIAVGHPFGMTGARLQNTMLNSLKWHDKSTGLITMCVGGGQGMAMILERLSPDLLLNVPRGRIRLSGCALSSYCPDRAGVRPARARPPRRGGCSPCRRRGRGRRRAGR